MYYNDGNIMRLYNQVVKCACLTEKIYSLRQYVNELKYLNM